MAIRLPNAIVRECLSNQLSTPSANSLVNAGKRSTYPLPRLRPRSAAAAAFWAVTSAYPRHGTARAPAPWRWTARVPQIPAHAGIECADYVLLRGLNRHVVRESWLSLRRITV
jgi:hypothetical protein